MRKLIKTGFVLTILATILVACNDKELPYEYVDAKVNVILKDGKITRFDQNENLNIAILTTEGVTVQSIEVRKGGSKIADATINDKKATFNAKTLAPYDKFGKDKDELYGSFDVSLFSKASNGQTLNNSYPVKVVESISIKDKVEKIEMEYKRPYDEKNKEGEESIHKKFNYSIFTAQATPDEIKLLWKKGEKGVYKDTGKELKANEKYTLNLKKIDYIKEYGANIGDVLYYKIIVKKGTVEESKVVKVFIVDQKMDNAINCQFSNLENYLNLSTGSRKEKGYEFLYEKNTISSKGNSIKLVKITGKEESYFEEGNLFATKKEIEEGTKINVLSNFTKGDMYAYQIDRSGKNYYGLIKINDVANKGTTDEKINISYKEGTLKL